MWVIPFVPTEAQFPVWPIPGSELMVMAKHWQNRPTPCSPDPDCWMCACTHLQADNSQHWNPPGSATAVSPSEIHVPALNHVLGAGKVWSYINVAQLELQFSEFPLPHASRARVVPREICTGFEDLRGRNKAQAIPLRRSVTETKQCCNSHTMSLTLQV